MIKLICFLLLLPLTRLTYAQQQPSLDKDPVFNYVLAHRITYPLLAARSKIFTKSNIYTHFRIDSVGHIQDILTLNPTDTPFGFEQQIFLGLKHMPPLNPAYEGGYIIPVIFVFMYGNGHEFTKPDTSQQTGVTNYKIESIYPGQTILSTLRVKAYK